MTYITVTLTIPLNNYTSQFIDELSKLKIKADPVGMSGFVRKIVFQIKESELPICNEINLLCMKFWNNNFSIEVVKTTHTKIIAHNPKNHNKKWPEEIFSKKKKSKEELIVL